MTWRSSIVRSLARLLGVRDYMGAKSNNHVFGSRFLSVSSNADDELRGNRHTLRTRSRWHFQNNASARAIVEADVALVVSTGIDVEPDTGNAADDDAIRAVWKEWCDHADASGRIDLFEMQRQARRSETIAGEALWVQVDVSDPKRPIPAAWMAVEPDQLADEPVEPVPDGLFFVDGVIIDANRRPVYYDILDQAPDAIHDPKGGSLVAGSGGVQYAGFATAGKPRGKRYPAERVIHGYEPLRPGQTRGEPRLAPILGTLHQERELVEAELTAAKIGAAHALAITTANGTGFIQPGDPAASSSANGSNAYDFTPGSVNVLAPGESVQVVSNPRPSQQISPFRQMLRGDLAGATGIPQRYIDRDSSRANYSSMRADMLDTRRIMDPQQQRFGRCFAGEVYRRILPQLCLAAGVVPPPKGSPERRRFEQYRIQPDGWAYVDPQKDVAAAIDAIRAGLSTWGDELHAKGKDPRQVHAALAQEISDPLLAGIFGGGSKATAPAAPEAEEPEDEDKPGDESETETEDGEDDNESMRHARALEIARASAPPAPVIHVAAPTITVAPATAPNVEIRNELPEQPAPVVNVSLPEQPAPTVNVTNEVRAESAPVQQIVVQAAAPTVHVAAPAVTVENTVEVPQRTIKAVPQRDGSVLMTPQE